MNESAEEKIRLLQPSLETAKALNTFELSRRSFVGAALASIAIPVSFGKVLGQDFRGIALGTETPLEKLRNLRTLHLKNEVFKERNFAKVHAAAIQAKQAIADKQQGRKKTVGFYDEELAKSAVASDRLFDELNAKGNREIGGGYKLLRNMTTTIPVYGPWIPVVTTPFELMYQSDYASDLENADKRYDAGKRLRAYLSREGKVEEDISTIVQALEINDHFAESFSNYAQGNLHFESVRISRTTTPGAAATSAPGPLR